MKSNDRAVTTEAETEARREREAALVESDVDEDGTTLEPCV